MSEVELWAVIAAGMALTYATRISFIGLVPFEKLPAWFRRGLTNVPAAVLAAMVMPALLMPSGRLDLGLANARLVAGAIAFAVGWRYRSMWLTIGAGFGALLLISAL